MLKAIAALAFVLSTTSIAQAQTCLIDGRPIDCASSAPRPPAGDPFAGYLFPPELIMANQRAINLTDAQRNSLQQAMADAQGKFVGLQFKMSSEVERLQALLQPSSVDEGKVLDQVDRVLAVEREVKRAQLSLMIRIKNLLTAQQQTQLSALRRQGTGE